MVTGLTYLWKGRLGVCPLDCFLILGGFFFLKTGLPTETAGQQSVGMEMENQSALGSKPVMP